MNLHRSGKEADWERVSAGERTGWQRLAARTRGLVTPANGVTAVGFGVVMVGLGFIASYQYWLGSGLLVAGRLLDIVDGWVAERTQTKGPVGEQFDAGVDKLGTLATMLTLVVAGVTAWWLIALLIMPQVIIGLVSTRRLLKGDAIHPSRAGKLSMAALWVSLVGLALVPAIANHLFHTVVYGTVALSVVAGSYSIRSYVLK